MSKCVLRAENFDKNGNRVPSKLFDLLEEYFGNLQDAWKYYDLSRQPEFRKLNPSVVQYDEFGDMTFLSFLKASLINADEVKLINMLNKELQSGEYSIKEAIEKVGIFNRVNSKEGYIGTLRFTEEGKAEIEVVRNTYDNRLELKNTIQSMNFFDRMLYKLVSLGVGVKLIDSTTIRGKYDTTTTKSLEDAINYLISIANDEQVQMEETLAKEIGHLILSSMRHSPLMERLEALLTDDVIKSIFGEDFLNLKDYRKEALGHLIGNELYRNQTQGGLKNLLNRVFSGLKRIWAKVTHNDVMEAHEEARMKALLLVKQFLQEDYSLDEDSIFEEKELLYDRESSSKCEKMFRNCLVSFSKLRDTYRALHPKLSYSFFKAKTIAESGRLRLDYREGVGDDLFDASMLEGIFESLMILSQYQGGMVTTLTEITVALKSSVTSEVLNPKVALNIRIVSSYVSQAVELIETLEEDLRGVSNEYSELVAAIRKLINEFRTSLIGYIDENGKEHQGMVGAIKKCEYDYSLTFLKQIYGKDYIKTAKRRLWSGKGLKLKSEAIDLSFKDILNVLNDDISLFSRFVTNMANSGDIVGELIDKQVKEADTASNEAIMEVWNVLKVLRDRTTKILGTDDTSIFYERDSEGKLTGNFISEDGYNWGEYYALRKAFIDKGKKDFKEWLEQLPEKYSETEAEVLWGKARKKLEHQWKKNNTITVNDKVFPIDKYKSTLYQELISKYPEIEPIYKETMVLYKSIIDNMIGGKVMPYNRAPLIRGSIQSALVEEMKNTNPLSATFSVLKRRLASAFVKNNEDLDFGGAFTYNSIDEDPAYSAIVYELEFIERAPLYFINLLLNKEDLKTDMFGSIEAFTVMASKYKSMLTILDSVEVVRETMLERRVGKNEILEKNLPNKVRPIKHFWKQSFSHSRAYHRLCKYIDMQIYNNYFNIDASKHRIMTALLKTIMSMSSLGSRIFLAGNMYGAFANVGTGAIEVFKEAMTNDVIKLNNYNKAHSLYMKEVFKSISDYGKEYKSSKMNLFLAMLDSQHGFANEAINWHPGATFGKDALNMKNNMFVRMLKIPFDFMIFYSGGDHYMQAIPYLSIALELMYVNPETGEKCNMYEVFEEVPIDENNPSIGNKLVFREGFIKEGEMTNIDTYNKIKELLNIAKNEDDAAIALINANQDYLNILYQEKLIPNNSQVTRANIHLLNKNLLNKKTLFGISLSDLSDIRNVAREMSIRMHGIYNNMDKTAFHGSLGGALMSAMKGYAFGMILRRFGPNTYNVLLDRNVEGTLNTMSKIFADFVVNGEHRNIDLEHGKRSILELIYDILHFAKLAAYPFSSKEQKILKDLGYDEWQISNTIRNFMDYLMIGVLNLTEYILEELKDDEEELNLWLGNALYFVTRLGAEQEAFNIPKSFILRELPSIINPDRSVGWSFTRLLYLNLWYMTAGALFDLEEAHYQRNQYSPKNPKFDLGYKEGENKGWHWVERYAPMTYGFPNPWLRFLHVWKDPERARETYLFSKQYGSK